jgi:3-methyladenine DNA glycosylase AlkD
MNTSEVLARLREAGSSRDREGMARFGIAVDSAFGVSVRQLREVAREIGRDHGLALDLYESGWHEARILATMIAEPGRMDRNLAEAWAASFDSWDVVDQTCNNLLRKASFAHELARAWAGREEEFVRRAGFTLMACLAVHDKKAGDAAFEAYLPLIERASTDDRNYVKKAVNWALRQIGKRNPALHERALACSRELAASDDAAARWIGRDAVRELESKKVRERLAKKASA